MKVTIIADASWCPETHAGGYGFWIASERGKYGGGGPCGRYELPNSALAAEMMALCNALYIAIKRGYVMEGDAVLLQTDCQNGIDIFCNRQSCPTLQERKAVEYLTGLVKGFKLTVEYRHVKGHTANPNARSVTNRLCDKRAKTHMREIRRSIQAKTQPELFERTSHEHAE